MSQYVRIVQGADFGEACLAALLESVDSVASPVVGLPTGNTPVAMFESLRRAVTAGRADVSQWRPFAIDEYGGPRNHRCSNRAFFEAYWDAIPGTRPVQQFDPEASDLAAECRRMAEALDREGGLDVALLGIGMNGHLAFNEPGSTTGSGTRVVQLHESSRISGSHCWGDETPSWGLTLGLRELLGAPAVIVMANGSAKARVVARALRGPVTPDVPASLVRHSQNAVWVVDTAAASALDGVESR